MSTHTLPLTAGIQPPVKGPHSPPPQAAGQPYRFYVDKMVDSVRFIPPRTEPLRQACELFCRFLSEKLPGLPRLQPFWITENQSEDLKLVRFIEVIEGEVIDSLYCVGPVG